MQVAGVVVQTLAALKPARNDGHEGFDRLEPVGDWRWLAEQLRIDADQELRILIGRAPEHDSVDMAQIRAAHVEVREAPVKDDGPIGMRTLQRMDKLVIERRDRPIVLGAQALKPGLARVNDERRGARRAEARAR